MDISPSVYEHAAALIGRSPGEVSRNEELWYAAHAEAYRIYQPVPCIIGGNTAPILDAMLETGTHYVVATFETDQKLFMEKIWDRTEIRVRVNMDVAIISRGPWQRIQADADRVIDLVRGRPNVCLGTGALPYETPPDHVLRLQEYVSRIQ